MSQPTLSTRQFAAVEKTTEALRVHFFQHIEGEGVGSPEQWLQERGAIVTQTEFFKVGKGQTTMLPAHDEVDLLMIMGGAMSVNDEEEYPWLKDEKAWIKAHIEAGKPTIGLCLGSQLIANALGAKVEKNKHKEIGWWPVHKRQTVQFDRSVFRFPDEITPLSWHGDFVRELPQGAIWLAENEATPHQAYQYGRHVLAFQFHPESTPDNLKLFLADEGYKDLTDGPYVQKADKLLAAAPQDFKAPNQLLLDAIEFVLEGARSQTEGH